MLGRNVAMKGLPYFTVGKVVKGFGRGSKDLGIPTANFPDEVVNGLPEEIHTGVYYGWAKLDNGPVHKMVMSIGWNPYFRNVKKSMETHILNDFGTDFYGSQLKVCLTGYIRPEMDFRTLAIDIEVDFIFTDDLISTIKHDIDTADRQLETAAMKIFKDHSFFQPESKEDKIVNGDTSH
ncbi:riboflavin kinase isoform X1 [Cryptotermes secundus]|uniref:riboflavin kinase isoform X1 n=1 Tax=Cryptotermes secundus TaxID=105785 RepID=UPI000CD7D249|nr:riboflavin kinase isoform X1 [Cryptotermes secundus]